MVGNTSGTAIRNNRAFLKFDLSELNGKTVTQAVLRIYENTAPTDSTKGVSLFTVTDSDAAANVNYAHTVSALGTAFYDPANFDLYTDIDVTAIVQGWVANPPTDFGFSLRSDVEGSTRSAKYFEGMYGVTVPELLVTYAVAVPEPGPLALLASAGLAGLGLTTFSRSKEPTLISP